LEVSGGRENVNTPASSLQEGQGNGAGSQGRAMPSLRERAGDCSGGRYERQGTDSNERSWGWKEELELRGKKECILKNVSF